MPQTALRFDNLLERLTKLNENSYTDKFWFVRAKGEGFRSAKGRAMQGGASRIPRLEGQRQDLGLLEEAVVNVISAGPPLRGHGAEEATCAGRPGRQ